VNQKGAHIDLNFIADTDTKRAKGVITKQSIVEELVEIDQLIDVWVSETDKGVLIKNFDGLVAEDLKLWCETNGVPYIISECYNDSYEEGLLYGQNYKGTYLPGGENLKINVSLGKVFAKDFTGMSKSEMVDWQKEVNKKKAHIELEFTYWYSSDIPKGKIIDQTVKDQEVELNTKIIVTVSLGAD
jgi:beta-lactam-binding protein with PASTA domain